MGTQVSCPQLPAVQARVERDAQGKPTSLLLSWIEASLEAAESRSYRFPLETSPAGQDGEETFATKEGNGFRELLLEGQPLHRHVTVFDAQQFEQTYKPFLHVYGPTSAELITKGPGGTYSHHRGIFLGWNKVRYGEEGKEEVTDFWHCKKGASIRHRHFLPQRSRSGPVYHDCAT